jgi:SAM-dependent methyltransferase
VTYPKFLQRLARKTPILGRILNDRDLLHQVILNLENQLSDLSNKVETEIQDWAMSEPQIGSAQEVTDDSAIYRADVINSIENIERPALALPENWTEEELLNFVRSIRVEGSPELEMRNYAEGDFRRFVYTLGLAQPEKGRCLELGGNPYFTTMLLHEFTDLDLSIGNFFGSDFRGESTQSVEYTSHGDGSRAKKEFAYRHFNIEQDTFPWDDAEFDLVIFAEIIEHLLSDPCKVLREIKRVLKDDGHLILTTPNICRYENVARQIVGLNLYDPYSGYGPYGRHNREYTIHEIASLLAFEGFEILEAFTADVSQSPVHHHIDYEELGTALRGRLDYRGQYIFVKARSHSRIQSERPSWLYRSLPAEEVLEAGVTEVKQLLRVTNVES